MDAKLVVVGENARPAEIKLNLPVTVGRGRQAGLVLPHPLISRRHCEICEANGYLVVRDLGSMNGTFIDNRRITEAILAPGQLLTLGTITLRAVYELSPNAGEASREAKTATPPPEVETNRREEGDSEDQKRTQDAAELQQDGDEASTEVSDVDPDEFLEQLREAERRSESP